MVLTKPVGEELPCGCIFVKTPRSKSNEGYISELSSGCLLHDPDE